VVAIRMSRSRRSLHLAQQDAIEAAALPALPAPQYFRQRMFCPSEISTSCFVFLCAYASGNSRRSKLPVLRDMRAHSLFTLSAEFRLSSSRWGLNNVSGFPASA
jgi:hypothetical protein